MDPASAVWEACLWWISAGAYLLTVVRIQLLFSPALAAFFALAGVVFGQLWEHHGGFCLAIYAFSSELLFGGLFLLLAELSHGLFFLLSLLTFWISILIDLGRLRQCGIAQSRPIIRAQEGCLSQPHKGAAQMGGCLALPSKGAHYLVWLLFWNASILVLITFILHSQSTWTLGSQVQTKSNSNCTIHGQIIILFLHNIISQPSS